MPSCYRFVFCRKFMFTALQCIGTSSTVSFPSHFISSFGFGPGSISYRCSQHAIGLAKSGLIMLPVKSQAINTRLVGPSPDLSPQGLLTCSEPSSQLTDAEEIQRGDQGQKNDGHLSAPLGQYVAMPGNITLEPSANFTRLTWWDTLLSCYGSTRVASYVQTVRLWLFYVINNIISPLSASQISADLASFFPASHYSITFLNAPLFFATLYNPVERVTMQPSLVFALLALSVLEQSNELEQGEAGRTRAREFLLFIPTSNVTHRGLLSLAQRYGTSRAGGLP
jgi:hypothetical protein